MARPACAGELVAGADAGGEHDDVGVEVVAVGEREPGDLAVGRGAHGARRGAGAHGEAEALDVAAQRRPPPSSSCTAIRRGANSTTVDVEAEEAQGVGRLEPEQATADDGTACGDRRPQSLIAARSSSVR